MSTTKPATTEDVLKKTHAELTEVLAEQQNQREELEKQMFELDGEIKRSRKLIKDIEKQLAK